MTFYFFIWTSRARQKVSEHGITIEEIEEVISFPDWVDISRTSGRPVAFGETSTGRFLCCVYELIDEITVQPITAYEIEY